MLRFVGVVLLAALLQGCATAPPRPPAEMVDQKRLMRTLAALPSGRAARGTLPEQRGLIATEALIVRELKAMGYAPQIEALSWNLKTQAEAEERVKATDRRPAVESDPDLAAHEWHNVIVEIPGRDLSREVLLLGAHFDAVSGSPGADDDGSGTAALLEVARVLRGRELKRTVRLVFFNLEEIGMKGSGDYVRAHKASFGEGKQKMVGMVSLEMLGYFSDSPGSQRSPIPAIPGVFEPPTAGDFIGFATVKAHSAFCRVLEREMIAAAPGLRTFVADFSPIAPPDFLRSDHAPFLMAGFPAVMLTDTSNFRNANYHKPTDTIATIDAERFTLVVRGLAGAAAAIANSP